MRPRGENIEYDKLRDRFDALAAELAVLKEDHRLHIERCYKAEARNAALEAAMALLTNGFKYSTEVCTIAREALGLTAENGENDRG